jgi:hypothetical protein
MGGHNLDVQVFWSGTIPLHREKGHLVSVLLAGVSDFETIALEAAEWEVLENAECQAHTSPS